MKKALLSGSHGFVGSHLMRLLPKMGIIPIALDRALFRRGLEHWLYGQDFDYIFHLASYGNLYSQTDEDEIVEANVINTYNLLQATKKMNYGAFINFSSSSVLLPYQTLYSAAKLSSEAICGAFVNKYDKPVFSVRPSTIYGPGDNSAHLIPKVIHSLSTDKKMDVVLSPKHDYIYIDDLIVALFSLIDRAQAVQGLSVNLSTGVQTTNEQVIHILEDIAGKKLKYDEVKSVRPYDGEWEVNNSSLLSTGWKAIETLETGLRKTYKAK